MKLRSRTTFAVAGAAVAIAASAGGALASGSGGGGTATTNDAGGPGLVISLDESGTAGPPAAIAGYLGLTEEELRTQLESGKTLAQVAADQGKSVDGLESAILAGAKARLDDAVAAGKITAAQEQEILDQLASHIGDLVNGAGLVHRTIAA
jgi:hypothetical protein